MRCLLVLALACCLCSVAFGEQSVTGNRLDTTGKGTYPGDGAIGHRIGGETIATATAITGLPFNDADATCGHINDYDEVCPYTGSSAPDVVYRYTPTASGAITADLCASSYDTKLYIYAGAAGNLVACNDDAGCGYSGWQSRVENVAVTAGVNYYIVVDGYGTSCGSYSLSVTGATPCVVTCPPGALQEGEPPCGDNYYDYYNGGCNSQGWTVIPAQAGGCAYMCGKSGTYLVNGGSYRDTDWYTLTAAAGTLTFECEAEFPLQMIIIYGIPCSNLQYIYTSVPKCVTGSLSWPTSAGQEIWLWAGPSGFSGVPCESTYLMHVCGIQAAPGACCYPDGTCQYVEQVQCQTGDWREGVACDPNPCPQPPPFGACCFPDGHCEYVQQAQCPTGDWREGVSCDRNPCPQPPPLGACCNPIDGSCVIFIEALCQANGGIWQGPGTICDPPDRCQVYVQWACCYIVQGGTQYTCAIMTQLACNGMNSSHWYSGQTCEPWPCGIILYTCCYADGTCQVTSEEQCLAGGGTYHTESQTCDPNPCPQPPPVGACCFIDGTCQILTEAECGAAQGQWYGATNPDCDPNPCPPPVPVERTTWGRIKEHYR
jgi:hypothetical protein